MKLVPNEFPQLDLQFRLAIIGEAPGNDEAFLGRPFVGSAGRVLNATLQSLGIARSACFVGNLCQIQPPDNDLGRFEWGGSEIQSGLNQLGRDLEVFQPNTCLLLGAYPNRAAGTPLKLAGKKDESDDFTIASFRGTIYKSMEVGSPFFGRKCVATLHPSALVPGRTPEKLPLFKFDVGRAFEEAKTRDLVLPDRRYDVDLQCSQIIDKLEAIKEGDVIACDIEGGVNQGITCISFATSPNYAFIVNWMDFGENEKVRLIKSVGRVLCNPRIYKILQNSLYDNFVLSWALKSPIRGVIHDTMLGGWEIYPELPKGLGTQASIFTREPYYKFERKVHDKRTHYIYCCKDSAVTYEIAQRHAEFFIKKPAAKEHFDFNVRLLPALNYMELKGFRYDWDGAKQELENVNLQMRVLEARMEAIAGFPVNPNCNNGSNSLSNVLYRKLGFEPQYKKEHGRKTDKLTADVEALLRLVKTDSTKLIYNILQWRIKEGVRKQLEIGPDKDGRIRCAYNLVGTETGRMTCYESPTESGTNLQTITKKLRRLYRADPGKVIVKCDLEGADGWTVAAHCARLGDRTMLDDYYAKIKPARVIAAMRQDRAVATMDRADLGRFIKNMDIPEWLYFACKRVQHGSNYGLGKITMSSVILKDSWKIDGNPIYVTAADCEALQRLYLYQRYRGVSSWQKWVTEQLFKSRSLSCASGHVRHFFGNLGHIDKPDVETYKAALSHEPQANTTYAICKVVDNLWHDPENYDSSGRLIIEPLHLVHDEFVGQVDESRIEWAKEKIRSYFNNPLMIAEHSITIPFDGGYGPSWGEQEVPLHS